MENKKKTVVSKSKSRQVDEKTGCKIGTIAFDVGKAYQDSNTLESALEKVSKIIKEVLKKKNKDSSDKHVRDYSLRWIGFMHYKIPKLYPELEKKKTSSKKEEAKA